jgi:hypothetical protein
MRFRQLTLLRCAVSSANDEIDSMQSHFQWISKANV